MISIFVIWISKIYDTNKYEALINNDFNFNSFDFISNKGLVTDYSLLLKKYLF